MRELCKLWPRGCALARKIFQGLESSTNEEKKELNDFSLFSHATAAGNKEESCMVA
jgi:hypothetical protein